MYPTPLTKLHFIIPQTESAIRPKSNANSARTAYSLHRCKRVLEEQSRIIETRHAQSG
jgi:hypothetical protein